MHNSVRNVALELHENIGAIEEWLATLPERGRRWLVHPIKVTRRWRQSLRTTRRSADVATYFRTFVMLRGKHRYKMECCQPMIWRLRGRGWPPCLLG
jgi:hypothetical protein